jgi:hypothetical protein
MAAHGTQRARRGSFADGQATDAGRAPVGRWSLGQELLDHRAGTVTGSFAVGQALTHPQPLREGRFSTGQEYAGEYSRPRPAAPAAPRRRERRLELSGRR